MRSSGGLVEHLSPTEVAQQSVTQIMTMTIMNLVTPKAEAKHELLFNNTVTSSPGLPKNSNV